MTIPLAQRFSIFDRDRFTCRFCGRRAPETELEVDHIHPRSKGGSDEETNLVTTCRDCNRGKGDRLIDLDPEDWSALVGKFCHLLGPDGYVEQQGRVLGWVGTEHLVIRLFDWVTGTTYAVQVRKFTDVADAGIYLYRTDEDMRDAYEHRLPRRPVMPTPPEPKRLVAS